MNYKFAPALLTKSFSKFYDPVTTLIGAGNRLQKIVLGIGNIQADENILDIGCGTGRFLLLAKLAHPTANFTGLDPDPEILKVAESKFNGNKVDIKLISAFAEQIPTPNQSFNKIFSTLAFHHIPKEVKKAALLEIRRVLKDDGYFFLSDLAKPKNRIWKIILHLESYFEPKAYIKDNLEGELPKIMEEAGFVFEETREPYLGIRFYRAKKS